MIDTADIAVSGLVPGLWIFDKSDFLLPVLTASGTAFISCVLPAGKPKTQKCLFF